MIYRTHVEKEKYFLVDYHLKSKTSLHEAAWS